jgi:multidrug resistance efflux pump/pimeloyl-ACP methyl ester carboxylesterase
LTAGENLTFQRTLLNDKDIDESSPPGRKQILHRLLQDGSGQDYFVYCPGTDLPDGPLFVAVHDISRNAREQVAAFADICEHYGATLIAPHFSASRFPNYQRLGRSRHALDRGRRANEALDAILEEVSSLTGVPAERVYLFGYGAGGRFAMRYAMAQPGRVAGVVIACAESYTFPNPDKRFPQGIAAGQKRLDLHFDPVRFLRVPMTVLDNARDGRPGARPQVVQVVGSSGKPVRNKGRKWVAAMRSAAEARQLDSLVSYREIDGPIDSMAKFAESGTLPDLVLESLLGPIPGLPVVVSRGEAPVNYLDQSSRLTIRLDGDIEDITTTGTTAAKIKRKALPAALAATVLAFVVFLGLWVNYRSTHVLSRDAVVRSHIADVGARLDGVVKSVEVDAGDRVQAGQVVARLEDSAYAARVAQTRSQLEKASRELEVERLAIDNERQRLSSSLKGVSAELLAARAAVRAAESRAEEAQRQVELQQSLVSRGLVPAERARTAETELRTAQALAAEARAQASAASAGEDLARVESRGLGVREKRVTVLESEVATLQAKVAMAEANLEATVIRAPDSGAVVRRIVQPGGSISVGQPIISLWVGGDIWVEAWVDEDDLADVSVGSVATVTFKSHPDREFSGVVESLGVSTDIELPDSVVPQPRSERMRAAPLISVRIRLDDPASDLFPGLSAVVGIRKKGD